jgi:hypothetical protein
VTNNYEDLEELYKEMLDVWGRYVGHVVTNVGVFTRLLKKKTKGSIYDIVPKVKQATSDAMVASQCFFLTWLVNVSTKKILIAGYTERFRLRKPDI